MSDDQQTDGLGRTAGARLVDEAHGAVQADSLREFAALCCSLEVLPGVRGPVRRWLGYLALRLAAETAGHIATALEENPGTTMRNVADAVALMGRTDTP